MSQAGSSLEPNVLERSFNRLFGLLLRLGLGLSHNYLLEVPGRKTGRIHSTPVNLLVLRGRPFLVAGRGYTQWVRNAQAAGEVTLRRGANRRRYRVRAVGDNEKPQILKAYLDRFKLTVQRYFPLRAGSTAESFRGVARRYPVFELLSLPPDEPQR